MVKACPYSLVMYAVGAVMAFYTRETGWRSIIAMGREGKTDALREQPERSASL